jgi:uncharacterized protein DUF3558
VRWCLIKVLTGTAMAMVLVAGCSDKQSGTALPVTTTAGGNTETSTGPTTPTTTSSGNVAEVKNPLDASKYLAQPCSILPASTLQQLKISRPGIPDTDSSLAKGVGPSCKWNSDDQPLGRTYGFGIITGNPHGIADIIRAGKKDFPGYFESTEISGYPAVFNGLVEDRPNGNCNLTVGISSSVAIRAGIQSNKDVGTKGCDLVKQVAATVIQTLKGA